jgi:hypothetical protein
LAGSGKTCGGAGSLSAAAGWLWRLSRCPHSAQKRAMSSFITWQIGQSITVSSSLTDSSNVPALEFGWNLESQALPNLIIPQSYSPVPIIS